jgi:ribosomal-protein-alanine N-acetyltransferase
VLSGDNICIRAFRPEDLPRLLRLERAAFPEDAWPRDLFESYAQRGSLFLVATADSALAGYCVVRQNRPGSADLDSIAVARRFRRHGIGSALLRSVLLRLRRRGIATVGLMVRRTNAGAIAFYRRYGFSRVKTVPGYYADGAAAWRMMRRVAAQTASR